ncbi:MAG: hypothetical protein K2J82_08075 [Muribaculaceae bacterium]|nr:hypothetical protein [Muribaculaceae bacterium]MDE6754553.1 hypothetical protein [Muribaculaceae bacterium]
MERFHCSPICILALLFIILNVTSCKSDDPISIDDPIVTAEGIHISVLDGACSFNVKVEGKWEAMLSESCDWATILNPEGVGNGTVEIIYDTNNTGIERHATITVKSGKDNVAVELYQAASIDGSAPDNDVEFIKLAGTKYIGYGCNLLEFFEDAKNNPLTYTSCNVVNTTAISRLMENDDFGEYATLANTTEITNTDYESVRIDTIVDKKDNLSVSLDIQIAYGLMKFGLSGAYHGGETLSSQVLQIKTGANYPTLEASVNYADILAAYDEWVEEGSPKKDYRMNLLTKGFAGIREQLRKACNEEKASSEELNGIVGRIIRDYGTGIVTRSKLGGMIALQLEVDSAYIKEVLSLDSAKITADIKAGLFNFKGEAKATYTNNAINHFRNSRHKIKMLGGDAKMMKSIMSTFENSSFDMKLADTIEEWSNTIVNSNDRNNTAELLEVEVKPIWVMFTDPKSVAAIKEYLKSKYPNSEFLKKYID